MRTFRWSISVCFNCRIFIFHCNQSHKALSSLLSKSLNSNVPICVCTWQTDPKKILSNSTELQRQTVRLCFQTLDLYSHKHSWFVPCLSLFTVLIKSVHCRACEWSVLSTSHSYTQKGGGKFVRRDKAKELNCDPDYRLGKLAACKWVRKVSYHFLSRSVEATCFAVDCSDLSRKFVFGSELLQTQLSAVKDAQH